MRRLDDASKLAVALVIQDNLAVLEQISGFVRAEPGFPIVGGRVLREPAVIVFVAHKKPPGSIPPEDRMPRQLGAYGVSVMQADPLMQMQASPEFKDVTEAMELAAKDLSYEPIEGNPIDAEFQVSVPFLCHAGPDAGWPVLRPFLEATKDTLSVAMYDFNADWISTAFIAAVRDNHLKVSLTWDNGMTSDEEAIRTKLKQKLGEQLDGGIVQCGSGRRFASAYHEKVAVRDSTAFWLSSGNWSKRSQPNIDPIGEPATAKGMYAKGNREWHVIVEDAAMAKVFEQYIQYDLQGCKNEIEAGDPGAALAKAERAGMPDLFVPLDQILSQAAEATLAVVEPKAPSSLPTHEKPVKVIPVLTPDNYLQRVTALIKGAKNSLYMQYAYITYSEKAGDKGFTQFLATLAELSNKPGLDMRIIVGSNGAADKVRRLAQAGFNDSVFRTQTSIHNKGIVVDGKVVLVSSANWSADGVLRNRDAGLIIHDPEVAIYYQEIFLDDWGNRAKASLDDDAPVTTATEGAATPPGMVRMTWQDYFG